MTPALAEQHQVDCPTEPTTPEEGYRRGLSSWQIPATLPVLAVRCPQLECGRDLVRRIPT